MGFHNSNGITNNGRFDNRQRKINKKKKKNNNLVDTREQTNLVHKSFFDPKNIPKLKKIEEKINAIQIPKKWV